MNGELAPLPDRFDVTVAELHRVAEEVVAPERKPENEIGLEATPGGFGTPVFEWEGARHQVRVEGTELVREVEGRQRREPLAVDPEATAALAAWYAFATEMLERLRGESVAGEAPTEPTLWPEHFDLAIEMGDERVGWRTTYGFSPGDREHREPYVYAAPWTAQVSGELWNARGFTGAELGYAELLAAGDPRRDALDFLRATRDALSETKPTEDT